MPAESALTTGTQESVGLPGVLTEANRITGGTSTNHLTPEITRWQKANVRISLTTETKTTHYHQNPVLPPQQVLDTPTHWKSKTDLKSYLMMMIEDFKKDMNNSLKEILENTINS